MSHVVYMNEAWHTQERVMSHIRMRHVAHMNAACCTYECGNVARMNAACRTFT